MTDPRKRSTARRCGRLRRACLLGLAMALIGGAGAGAEIIRMESVGAAPVGAEESSQVTKQRAALGMAVRDAVLRVADGLLAPEAYESELESSANPRSGGGRADPDPEAEDPREFIEARLDAALGDQPLDYAIRFRILEDRGERPALFVDDPEIVSEYVMVAEVFVDSDRVRSRLAQAGIPLIPSGEGDLARIRVVLLDVESFRAFSAVRETLARDPRVQSAVPVEMERGRAVLEVVAARDVGELLESLRRGMPDDVAVTPVAIDFDQLTLRVSLAEPDPPGGASLAAPAIDTTGRNRY